MTNRYPGKCTKCGQTVHPETGTCEKVGGKWVVSHTTCPTGESPSCNVSVGLPDDWDAISNDAARNLVPGTCCKCGQQVRIGHGFSARSASGKWYAWHSECPAAPEATTATETIRKGEGYGGREYKPGQVVRHNDGWWTVVRASKRYYREDGMSFGVGDEKGYVYSATIRPATDAEAAPMIAKAAEAAARKAQEVRRAEVAEQIKADGEWPEGMQVPGEEICSDRRTIYGGGDWFVVGAEHIWYVQNNGADGDDWSRNNVTTGGAGAIGWRVAYDEALAAEVKAFPA
jgi:hypothetical protein